MRKAAVIIGISALAGCSSTPQSLENSPSAVRTTKTYAENYQEVYRRLVTTARICSPGPSGSYTAFQLATDLYSELGYGEVSLSLNNLGAKNYYWKAKVEKIGNGSRLSVVSGNTLVKASQMRTVVRWADGDPKC